MLHVRFKLLLLMTAHLPLLCTAKSHTEAPSSSSGRDKVKPDSCGKDCKDRSRKGSPTHAKCDLYYFAPTATAPTEDDLFAFWNNTKAEHLETYRKIASFLQTNSREDEPLFFPAHIPLVEKRNGRDVLVLKDIYVRAQGACGSTENNDPVPAWFAAREPRLRKNIEMLEDYVQRMPRSHWGYRAPKKDDVDVCLDDTGLVVKDFPGIRTCFSMWIFDVFAGKPKHFAGRQIYNRINQARRVNISTIDFEPSSDEPLVEPIGTELFSLPALFLEETCYVTNASLENRCMYWATNRFYVSLCCCYTNRTDCAYRSFKFPSQKKSNDTKIRACATGEYYVLKPFGGSRKPKNASGIASSVKEFIRERTSSEVCRWTYTWDPRDETPLEDVLRVNLYAVESANISENMRSCALLIPEGACCQRMTYRCPRDPDYDAGAIECYCSGADLCNKRNSYLKEIHVKMFREARPCETHTAHEHLLLLTDDHKKPNTNVTTGYMCPVFYNFARPGRRNAFLQLENGNNFVFREESDDMLFTQDGCYLVEVEIHEEADCPEKIFGEHNQPLEERLLILLCVVEGNPLGVRRPSYPDAELKKTIAANLTAAKEAFPTCKNGSWSLDFKRLSQLVVDNHDITTVNYYVEVSFVYQQQYNFTFGAISMDDEPLHNACHVLGKDPPSKCVRLNSTADDEHRRFACCCQRHWNNTQDMCREVLLDQLKTLLNASAITKKPEKIMSELKKDPLTKCVEPEKTNAGQAGTDVSRPCARNEGCYTDVHARDVPTSKQPKEVRGCVSENAPEAKKREVSVEAEARFDRICRLPRNQGECFAVLGTEDPDLPDDVKGPQIVCCCRGRLGSAQKCGTSYQFGMLIGDLH